MPTAPPRTELASTLGSWFGASAGALAWTAHLLISYALQPAACATGLTIILHAVTLGALLVTAAGGVVAYRDWRAGRAAEPTNSGRQEVGHRWYMGLSGVLLNALFGFATLLEGLPVAFVNPCW
jgi:hypothetical protein